MSNDVRYIYDSRMHENVATLDPRRMGVNVRVLMLDFKAA